MERKKTKICFVNSSNPNELGGVTLYQKNLIKRLDKNKFDVTWIYKGKQNEIYKKDGISFLKFKVPKKILFWNEIVFNKKVKKFLDKNYYDIINSHAVSGHWMKKYKKKKNQRIIHTYHGLAIPYYKIQLKQFPFLKRAIISLFLNSYSKSIEKPPIKKADKIICVSEKVKNDVYRFYGRKDNILSIRTGVDLKDFAPIDKNDSRKEIKLPFDRIYGLYVGKGGYWIKGLDKAVQLGEKIYKKNKSFRLIVIGAELKKVKKFLNKRFIIYKKEVDRNKMPFYYSGSDMLFCFSRYEGGAPTLTVSEAMSCGCLVISTPSAKQEILENEINSLIIKNFDDKDVNKMLNLIKDKNKKEKIISESIKTIRKLSLSGWSKKYLEALTK